MKKALLILVGLTMAPAAFGQGIITFFNNNLTGPNGTYRAGIFRHSETSGDSTVGAGAGFTAGLFLASDLNTPLATTTFRTGTAPEVFATTQDVVIPGVQPGQQATLIVAAWNTSAGSLLNARNTGGEWGMQQFTSRALGGPSPDPTQPAIFTPDMGPGFTGFEMQIPEPSMIGLGVIGAGALLMRRRR